MDVGLVHPIASCSHQAHNQHHIGPRVSNTAISHCMLFSRPFSSLVLVTHFHDFGLAYPYEISYPMGMASLSST